MFPKLDNLLMLMATSNSPLSAVAVYMATSTWQRAFKEFCRMKKAMICVLLAMAVAGCAPALYAQMQGGPGQGGGMGRGMAMSPEQRLQHMTQMLDLSEEQQKKIKPILEDQSQQMQKLHEDATLTPQERRSKMQEIRQTTHEQIKPILTADQQTKWEQMQMQGRRTGPPNRSGTGQGTPSETPQQAPPPQ